MITQVCNTCNVMKPIEEFTKNKKCKLGVEGKCRKCTNLVSAKWQKENKKKYNETVQKWRSKNREKACANTKKWQKANREKALDIKADWDLKTAIGLPKEKIPKELLEANRIRLRIKRLVKEKTA